MCYASLGFRKPITYGKYYCAEKPTAHRAARFHSPIHINTAIIKPRTV
jgi:hypothetical protein